jgi:hypothetical protein
MVQRVSFKEVFKGLVTFKLHCIHGSKSCLTDAYWFFTKGVSKLREQTSSVSPYQNKKKFIYTRPEMSVFFFLISLNDDVHL